MFAIPVHAQWTWLHPKPQGDFEKDDPVEVIHPR
jgi:hypothetical protein